MGISMMNASPASKPDDELEFFSGRNGCSEPAGMGTSQAKPASWEVKKLRIASLGVFCILRQPALQQKIPAILNG